MGIVVLKEGIEMLNDWDGPRDEQENIMQTIGWAVKQLQNGSKVGRSGWNGKGMYLELQVPDAHSKMTLPYVYMKTAQDDLVPWLCSQTDLLATDWEIAE